ncbi:MAG: sigma-54 dependent transcriptional regulator [Candidatus Cloacimonetes bacterium]|nr:sigma-54 dependent transcriptional regulator [Candidatus Cloacimonadota bacterium]
MPNLNILVLDDEKKITEKIKNYLIKKEFNAHCANSPEEAFNIMNDTEIDILISDILMPGMNGLEVLKNIKKKFPQTEVIMISGHGDVDTVIEAIRLGAVDFIRKPFRFMDVQLAIERTGKYISLQNQLKNSNDQISLISQELESKIEKNFIGISSAIRNVLDLALTAAADKDVNVLITGENGTGKEIIARIIHYSGARSKMPFFPVNSAAIPETLLESEFFGHIKGAFTGATENKKGYMELANMGTLFLDEIADMPLTLQAKLLRVLEDHKIKKVGDVKEIKVDNRLISATNKNIDELINENKFRIDLFHRINTIIINIPPLREHPEDIEVLIKHFVKNISMRKNKITPEIDKSVIKKLMKYHFPGNVRELKNMVERALILSKDDVLWENDFLISVNDKNQHKSVNLNLDENEIKLIKIALKKTSFNQNKASVLLGISRDALKRRLQKYKMKIVKNSE